MEYFIAQVTARTAADLAELNRNTVSLFYKKLRLIIEHYVELEAKEYFSGEVEVDESYFGGHRKGKRGRGAGGKVKPDSIVYTDCYRSYNALDVSEFHHFRINHSTHFGEDKYNHINGIENFWNQAKRSLRLLSYLMTKSCTLQSVERSERIMYNGVPKNSFNLFLKECEFRFNYGSPKEQLKTLKKWCY